MGTWWMRRTLVLGLTVSALVASSARPAWAGDRRHEEEVRRRSAEKTLYIWAGDAARVHPDFLAVIDFNENSANYGKVLRTIPLPPPGNVGNEPHHCHLSVDKNILACGGLLSVLSGQNGIFFFDVSDARKPEFLFSTRAPNSSITDDFLPLPEGASS